MAKQEEPKLTLPAGHPQAGYLSPDTSLEDGIGLRPDVEQQAVDEANKAREDEAAAITDHEHKVATEEAAAAAEAAAPAPAPKAAAAKS